MTGYNLYQIVCLVTGIFISVFYRREIYGKPHEEKVKLSVVSELYVQLKFIEEINRWPRQLEFYTVLTEFKTNLIC